MFVWDCEVQIPKPERSCKLKTDRYFGLQIDTVVEQIVIFLMVKKIRYLMADFVRFTNV